MSILCCRSSWTELYDGCECCSEQLISICYPALATNPLGLAEIHKNLFRQNIVLLLLFNSSRDCSTAIATATAAATAAAAAATATAAAATTTSSSSSTSSTCSTSSTSIDNI